MKDSLIDQLTWSHLSNRLGHQQSRRREKCKPSTISSPPVWFHPSQRLSQSDGSWCRLSPPAPSRTAAPCHALGSQPPRGWFGPGVTGRGKYYATYPRTFPWCMLPRPKNSSLPQNNTTERVWLFHPIIFPFANFDTRCTTAHSEVVNDCKKL